MKPTLILIATLLLAPLAALHAADAPTPSFVKTGVILVNHVGFPPNAAKHCVIPSPPEREFTIHQLKDTVWTHVFAGALIEGGNELEPGWVGDFSALAAEYFKDRDAAYTTDSRSRIHRVECWILSPRQIWLHERIRHARRRQRALVNGGTGEATRKLIHS